MIEKNTVFILGAGASCSYGFPNGETLITETISAVKDTLAVSAARNALIQNDDYGSFLLLNNYGVAPNNDVQINGCHEFVAALSNAGQASIDAFLYANQHKKGFDAIGKGAIAKVLLKYENKVSDKKDDDWLSYLFKIMIDGMSSPDQFIEKNKASFITFNYDRFLEKWLYTKIKHSFGLDDSSTLEVLRKISIHHVYGMLGDFPELNPTHPHRWVKAAAGIRTIFDIEKAVGVISESKSLLEKSDVICMLGFGFHRENINLLDLATYVQKKISVFASRYDILDVELKRLPIPFDKKFINFSQHGDKCRMTLRSLNIF